MNYRRPDKEERIQQMDRLIPQGKWVEEIFPEKCVHVIAISDAVDTEKDNLEVQ